MKNHCRFDVAVSAKDITLFAKLSGDTNPLHMDAAYAKKTEYGRPIAHGAFLVGLVSRVLGMQIPGERSLILSMAISFPKPLYYPSTVTVDGQLVSYNAERNVGVVRITIEDQAKKWRVLEADVTFSCHEKSGAKTVAVPATLPVKVRKGGKKRLLVTGGTGGLGKALLPLLLPHYDVDCLTRQAASAGKNAVVRYHRVDLDATDALDAFLKDCPAESYYGILHLSAPPMSRGFASDNLSQVRDHLRHGVEVPLRLAQWAKQNGSSIRRMVVMGSTAGTKYPKPHYGAYSLGKAALEHVVKLLPTDFAAHAMTVNGVLPNLIPVGMNEGLPERILKGLEARTPTGKLTAPEDIAHVILFLLSDAAQQINGTLISVDGGFSEIA